MSHRHRKKNQNFLTLECPISVAIDVPLLINFSIFFTLDILIQPPPPFSCLLIIGDSFQPRQTFCFVSLFKEATLLPIIY